ncbi:AAA family ATPase [Kineobactrum salinum]|uniref:AAA family ATPase n=1 Tax=Kineobactrum salinum TaxID=2708301 RepID=A0A6C0TZD3_9GAMM|nr:AAA family ATPase [Kineobactrum salinum]QIB64729.1 AAA family ATPase [Kineobactrum salinum]
MYDQFYRFNAEPFRLSPDHAFAYAHKGYTKARAYMAYAFLRAEGFVMITGRPGTGKTTLIGALLDQLAGENVTLANLVCTQLQADDLLKLVAYEFGVAPAVVHKGELLQRLTQQLKSWYRDGRRALLIVDEAQDLSVSAMEELRLLTNIQVDGRPLLQIFLLGQPELRELVLSPELEQVHQRIVAATHLRPLELDETEAYILHRLEVVGWCGDPSISRAIFPLVYKFSEGIPRRINLICSRLLLHCAVEQRHRVTVADMQEVVRELQDESLAAGAGFTDRDFQVEDEFDAPAPGEDDPQVAGSPDAAGSAQVAAGSRQEPGATAADSAAVGQETGVPGDNRSTASEGAAAPGQDSAPPPDMAQQMEQLVHEAAESRSSERQHLKVVSGAAGDAAVRSRMAEELPERQQQVSASGSTFVPLQPSQAATMRAPVPADKRGRASRRQPRSRDEIAALAAQTVPAKEAAVTEVLSVPGETRRPHARAPSSSRRVGRNRSDFWTVTIILLISIILVSWAATGFMGGPCGGSRFINKRSYRCDACHTGWLHLP